jgi:hypothetical protein
VLAANAAAILVAVLVVSLDVNAIPAVLFPIFVTAAAWSSFASFLAFAGVHILCVVLASTFAICSVFALLGTASALLPRDTFRAVSSWLRGAILLAFLALLFSALAGPNLLRHLEQHPASLARFLPSLWFVAFYQVLQHRSTPLLLELIGNLAPGFATVLVLTIASYTLSYRRRFAAVLESGRRPGRQRLLRLALDVLDAFAPRAPGLARAGHRFIVRGLLRTETHRLALAVALGLGGMAALQNPGSAALSVAFLLILALRIAFELPAGAAENWVFRAILDPRRSQSAGVARRVILAFLVPVVLVPCCAVACWRSGPLYAFIHTAYILALSLTLIELLLSGYRKFPLTCPMPGFRENFLMLCLVQFLGFVLFTAGGAALERWMWIQPWRFALVPLAMAAAWHWNRGRLAEARENGELEEGLTFENAPIAAVQLFDLSDAT